MTTESKKPWHKTDKPWQFLAVWTYGSVLGFVFMLAAYRTTSQWGTVIYEITTLTFSTILIVTKYFFFRKERMPFEAFLNAPSYAYTLALFLVPMMYGLAQVLTLFLTGTFATQSLITNLATYSWVPEVFSPFLPLSTLPILLPWLGTFANYLQQFALEMSDVAPAEELFKTAVINSILIIILWRLELLGETVPEVKARIKRIIFYILTAANGLWTVMHGILEYHTLSDFLVAFLDGELLLLPTWIFGTPFPAILSHGTWNTMGSLGFLTDTIMIVMAVLFGSLTIFLYARAKWWKKP